MALVQRIMSDLGQWFIEKSGAEKDFDALTFTKMGIVALSSYSSILAVDVGMTEEQFRALNDALFKETYRQAPKFGP